MTNHEKGKIAMRKTRIKPEQFVRLWLEAVENRKGISWISQTIGCSDQTVHSMAASLRGKGVELPSIRRTFAEAIDVSKMNDLIRKQFGN